MITKFKKFKKIKNNKILYYIVTSFNKKEIKNKLIDFKEKSKEQGSEYKKALDIIVNYKISKKLTDEESQIIKNIFIDTFKISVLSAVFLLPAGSIWIVALIKLFKLFKINILPSKFEN